MRTKRIALICLVVALSLGGVMFVGTGMAADPNVGRVRVLHAVPSGLVVDIEVDGDVVTSNLSYKGLTPYYAVEAGEHTVEVWVEPWPYPALSETAYLTGGMDFTIAGVGQGFDLSAASYEDDNSPSNSDTVRFIHLSPNTGPIDVAVRGTLVYTIASNVPYTGTSGYIGGLGPGPVVFEVRSAGEITPLLTITPILEQDTINTFFIVGLSGNEATPLEVIHSVDQRFFWTYMPLMVRELGGPGSARLPDN
jgi:hypothetical protein